MRSVALICTANRCRSVMAHAIFVDEAKKRSLPVEVYSAGVLDFSDAPRLDETSRMCLQHNTPPPDKAPTWIRELPLESINRFLVMEQDHADALVHIHGIAPHLVSLLGEFDPRQRGPELSDPYGLGQAAYERSYLRIRDCIVGYLETTDDLSG